jgi:hypothetical protein
MDRYLIRFETAIPRCFAVASRLLVEEGFECLRVLRDLGVQTAAG